MLQILSLTEKEQANNNCMINIFCSNKFIQPDQLIGYKV